MAIKNKTRTVYNLIVYLNKTIYYKTQNMSTVQPSS